MKTYSTSRLVTAADLDDLQHVNNVRYLEWVQEISRAHWQQLTKPGWDKRFLWVVRSHHITYHQPALLGQTLLLTTYVPEARGPISRRKVEMELESSGARVAECLTEWVLLDATSGRPVRIPEEILRVFD